MELTIYSQSYSTSSSIKTFLGFYYSLNMKHLASDLLKEGLSPRQISDAVVAAIKVANTAEIDVKEHFMPIYIAINQEVIKDCKLSNLGYGLVLLNADVCLSVVGKFQINVLNKFLQIR
jgi:hypothetical protein